jgi:hypothetical protein
MTGTPLDLTPFGVLLDAVGIVYWLIFAMALWFVLRGKKSWQRRVVGGAIVVVLFGAFPGYEGWKSYQALTRLRTAEAKFQERCKTAGEKISRTVENVDGVVWMKWREPYSNAGNFADQFKLDDPYGRDCGAEGCLYQLLRANAGATLFPKAAKLHASGYQFVETIDPRDGVRYRYTATLKAVSSVSQSEFERHVHATGSGAEGEGAFFALERQPVDRSTARYGITWDDISTREDREHWIAGGSLKIVDLQTNEIVAERIGYMVDRGQGSQAGFRSPWLMARRSACPALVDEAGLRTNIGFTQRFTFKVLQPGKGS